MNVPFETHTNSTRVGAVRVDPSPTTRVVGLSAVTQPARVSDFSGVSRNGPDRSRVGVGDRFLGNHITSDDRSATVVVPDARPKRNSFNLCFIIPLPVLLHFHAFWTWSMVVWDTISHRCMDSVSSTKASLNMVHVSYFLLAKITALASVIGGLMAVFEGQSVWSSVLTGVVAGATSIIIALVKIVYDAMKRRRADQTTILHLTSEARLEREKIVDARSDRVWDEMQELHATQIKEKDIVIEQLRNLVERQASKITDLQSQ